MRTPEEKAKIIEEYLNGEQGLHYYERKYNIHYQVLHRWYNKYLEDGIDGLKSKTWIGYNKLDNFIKDMLK